MALGLAAQLGHGGDDQHKELITHTFADGLRDDPYGDEPTEPIVAIGTTARIDGASVPL